jgi:hypothetical protein
MLVVCFAWLGAAVCVGAVLAACSFTAKEIATTETTGRNTMIHRIFITQTLYSNYGNESYRRRSGPATLRRNQQWYATK